MDTLTSTLFSPFTDVKGYNIVLGLDWLWKNKPHVDCITSSLVVSREVEHRKVYPKSVEQLMKNRIFVRITKTQEEQ